MAAGAMVGLVALGAGLLFLGKRPPRGPSSGVAPDLETGGTMGGASRTADGSLGVASWSATGNSGAPAAVTVVPTEVGPVAAPSIMANPKVVSVQTAPAPANDVIKVGDGVTDAAVGTMGQVAANVFGSFSPITRIGAATATTTYQANTTPKQISAAASAAGALVGAIW